MPNQDFYDLLKQYALDSKTYKGWRKEHTKVFGSVFADAFSHNEEAQICLTAALIQISKRCFDRAMPKLDMLETVCDTPFDETAIAYFKGLNYEMLENETEMNTYYEKVKRSSVTLSYIIAFHPYYRTAKFAQRASECSKALHYYRKALAFYDGIQPDRHEAPIVSQLLYDIATVYLFKHDYRECERFLKFSRQYDPSQNPHRDYVHAILCAIYEKHDECKALLDAMNPFFRTNCQAIIDAIANGKELHYCTVSQDRSLYGAFWTDFLQDEKTILAEIANDALNEAEKRISEKLTKTLAFAKCTIDCRIEKNANFISVKCKNYQAKSLKEELSALFQMKPTCLFGWEFLSADEFESYEI